MTDEREMQTPTLKKLKAFSWENAIGDGAPTVVYTYAQDDDGTIYQREVDRSDGSTTYYVARNSADIKFEPWNRDLDDGDWERLYPEPELKCNDSGDVVMDQERLDGLPWVLEERSAGQTHEYHLAIDANGRKFLRELDRAEDEVNYYARIDEEWRSIVIETISPAGTAAPRSPVKAF
jgi:hypothetical protein